MFVLPPKQNLVQNYGLHSHFFPSLLVIRMLDCYHNTATESDICQLRYSAHRITDKLQINVNYWDICLWLCPDVTALRFWQLLCAGKKMPFTYKPVVGGGLGSILLVLEQALATNCTFVYHVFINQASQLINHEDKGSTLYLRMTLSLFL